MTHEQKAIFVASGLLKAADMAEKAILGLTAKDRKIGDALNRLADNLRAAAHGERMHGQRLDRSAPIPVTQKRP